jgi:hypothetical protein
MKRPNPLAPDRLTSAERYAEVAEILAEGLVRLRARQSTELSANRGESRLDISPTRSGHARRTQRREARR